MWNIVMDLYGGLALRYHLIFEAMELESFTNRDPVVHSIQVAASPLRDCKQLIQFKEVVSSQHNIDTQT